MKKYYNIADLNVTIDSFGTTEERAEKYRCEPFERTDIEVVSRWEITKAKHPDVSDDVGEHMSTANSFYTKLLDFDGIRLHSSAVVVDGRAYLFSATSGTGKSTHTGLWLELFGDKAYIINDDKPAVRLRDGVWYAYGTPWSGKHDISVNKGVPIAGIAVIERAEQNKIEPFKGIEATKILLSQINRPKATEACNRFLELLDKLLTTVPIWRLSCNMEPEAAKIAYEAMSGEKI